jgi:hypothetical protein
MPLQDVDRRRHIDAALCVIQRVRREAEALETLFSVQVLERSPESSPTGEPLGRAMLGHPASSAMRGGGTSLERSACTASRAPVCSIWRVRSGRSSIAAR